MTNVDHETLEDLLRHVPPRPTPATAAAAAARAAVRGEWQEAVGQRRRRRRVAQLAVAATILIGVFATFNLVRVPTPVPVRVATIDKSFGSVYMLGEQSELRETDDLAVIVSGQTIVTGRESGLALAWGDGGSLRLDQNTRVEFVDGESVFLQQGRLYFDSRGATLAARDDEGASPVFRLHTALGDVQHVGTQYMARVDGDTLVVSVREGEVDIDGRYYEHRAGRGEQVTLNGGMRPSVLTVDGAGGSWGWIGKTTPVVDVDGRSLLEFLKWVSRELGLQLAFEGGAETVARSAILRGSIDSHPADELRMRLASAALAWRIEGGIIYVGD